MNEAKTSQWSRPSDRELPVRFPEEIFDFKKDLEHNLDAPLSEIKKFISPLEALLSAHEKGTLSAEEQNSLWLHANALARLTTNRHSLLSSAAMKHNPETYGYFSNLFDRLEKADVISQETHAAQYCSRLLNVTSRHPLTLDAVIKDIKRHKEIISRDALFHMLTYRDYQGSGGFNILHSVAFGGDHIGYDNISQMLASLHAAFTDSSAKQEVIGKQFTNVLDSDDSLLCDVIKKHGAGAAIGLLNNMWRFSKKDDLANVLVSRGSNTPTPLQIAVGDGHEALMKEIIYSLQRLKKKYSPPYITPAQYDAQFTCVSPKEYTLLHSAICGQNYKVYEYISKKLLELNKETREENGVHVPRISNEELLRQFTLPNRYGDTPEESCLFGVKQPNAQNDATLIANKFEQDMNTIEQRMKDAPQSAVGRLLAGGEERQARGR